ncbi:MAG: OmpA family protein [Bacteroidota bacterium]
MNEKVLILALAFLVWLFLGASWWSCPLFENCEENQQEVAISEPVEPAAPELKIGMKLPTGPLTFNWGDFNPQTSDLFPAFRDSLKGLLKDNQKFEIVGTYFAKEKAPAGFENMGFARASKIRDLFMQAGMDSSRFRLRSSLDEMDFDTVMGEFVASVFNYKVVTETIVEGKGRDFTIFFPFGSNEMLNDPAFKAKLDEAAAYLNESQRHVNLTGHTDAEGMPDRNEQLGLARANGIREELQRRGVNISQINTYSKGESELLYPDQPDAAKNRRVEVNFPN